MRHRVPANNGAASRVAGEISIGTVIAYSIDIMIRRFTHITLWTAVLVLLLTCRIHPVSAVTNDSGALVLDLINQYRTAPYDHGITLGYDPLNLAAIGILPDTRFAPYVTDDTLNQAAADANTLTAVSEPEVPVSVQFDRPQIVQTEAVLTFSNFIPGETAATLFAENLLKNELNTGEFDFVFASGYSHAGASVDPGVQDGRNAWFSTLMLGTSARITDMQMLNLINQVRAEPGLIKNYLTGDLETVLQQNMQTYLLLTLQFQPIFFDGLLYEMAKADVLTPEAVSSGSDNRMILHTETGDKAWPGEWFQAMTAAGSWENMDEARPVTDLFTALLYQELAGWPYNAVIFSNHYTETGTFVFLDTGEPAVSESVPVQENTTPSWEPDGSEILSDNSAQSGSGVVTLCAGSAVPVPPLTPGDDESLPETAHIYGLLFLDQDDDSFYAPGEELAGEIVDVYPLSGEKGLPYDGNVEPAFRVVTDHAGHFSLSLEPGRQWVFETWKDDQVSRRIIYIDTDQFVKISFFPPDLL